MKEFDLSATYEDRYINFADIPETRARERRYKEFKSNSHFTESLFQDNPRHQALCKLIKTKTKGEANHVTFFELGNMAVVMTEPYNSELKDYKCAKFYAVEIPVNIAPYCGRFDATPGAEPWTKGFLITSILKKRQLDEVIKRLIKREKELPPWNKE